MKYLLARRKKKTGKYWTYIVENDKFVKFTEKQGKEVLKDLKVKNKSYDYKLVAVK